MFPCLGLRSHFPFPHFHYICGVGKRWTRKGYTVLRKWEAIRLTSKEGRVVAILWIKNPSLALRHLPGMALNPVKLNSMRKKFNCHTSFSCTLWGMSRQTFGFICLHLHFFNFCILKFIPKFSTYFTVI